MSLADRNYQEKRGFLRMKIDSPVDIELLEDGSHHRGICRDLSGGGMLVEIDSTLPVGSELKVRIASGHGHAPILEANTLVARVVAQPSSEHSSCLLGLEIDKVHD
ncbi:PilZ domain-containing protein [Agaribacterium haliotis]|uniref:PilZ domain-containing protein n=1 Tax=Agaribacterium haliotis TaxID=2013869 RepID=UPI000BB56AE8|nr:PilZ domain-containing protein [Agaribacterium haliotis]